MAQLFWTCAFCYWLCSCGGEGCGSHRAIPVEIERDFHEADDADHHWDSGVEDVDAGEDAGAAANEWRQIITPQPTRVAPPRADWCTRPAYRNKRECKGGQTRLERRHAQHHVGC